MRKNEWMVERKMVGSEAIKEGMPKVGDTVYWLFKGSIITCWVYAIWMADDKLCYSMESELTEGAFTADAIGKTVFMTKEEAEEALKQ